jgi:hypothetical protein
LQFTDSVEGPVDISLTVHQKNTCWIGSRHRATVSGAYTCVKASGVK